MAGRNLSRAIGTILQRLVISRLQKADLAHDCERAYVNQSTPCQFSFSSVKELIAQIEQLLAA
jgi:hypothetical protein